MTPLTVDELILKGTHNSYSGLRARPLCVYHPPDRQVDDFGVWSIELDFSVEFERGEPVAVVGHDRPGDSSSWGYYLTDYVAPLLRTRSLLYRPVFLYLEVKSWRRSWLRPWRSPADTGVSFRDKWDAGLEALRAGCGDRVVLLEDWVVAHDRWPLPLELAGKIVVYEPNRRLPEGRLVGLRGTHAARCVTPWQVEAAIDDGIPMERNGASCPGGARALRLEQYQADWTFDYGVPPNPLVVDPEAPAVSVVRDAEGKRWRCGEDTSHGQRVSEHGTFRFPYRTIEQAIERARGITPVTHGRPDPRRAGFGWTVLARPGALPHGSYQSDFPVVIEVDGD